MTDTSKITKLELERKNETEELNNLRNMAKETIDRIRDILYSDKTVGNNVSISDINHLEEKIRFISDAEKRIRMINDKITGELKKNISQKLPDIESEATLYEILKAIENKNPSKTIDNTTKSFEEIQHMLYRDIRCIDEMKEARKNELYAAGITTIMALFEKYKGRNVKEALLLDIGKNIYNVGKKTIDKMESFLAEYGFDFSSDVSKYKKEQG